MRNMLYESRRKWCHHIRQTHASASITDDVYDCSICKPASLSAATFQRHVGQHLEELGLFLLPRTSSDKDKNAVTDEENGDGSVNEVLSEAPLDDFQVNRRLEQRDDIGKTASDSDSHPDGDSSSPFNGPALPQSTESESQDEDASQDSGGVAIEPDGSGELFTETVRSTVDASPAIHKSRHSLSRSSSRLSESLISNSARVSASKIDPENNSLPVESTEEFVAGKSINIRVHHLGGKRNPHQDLTGNSSSGNIGQPGDNPPNSSSPGKMQFKGWGTRPAYGEDFDEDMNAIIPESR